MEGNTKESRTSMRKMADPSPLRDSWHLRRKPRRGDLFIDNPGVHTLFLFFSGAASEILDQSERSPAAPLKNKKTRVGWRSINRSSLRDLGKAADLNRGRDLS